MLLRALKILKEKHHLTIPLVLTGSDKGFLSTVLKTAQSWGLDQQIHFLGFVTHDELRWLYQNANALVYPSFFGPDNIPPLEAFALECPVIASNVSGAGEQLGEAALLFELNDDQSLVKHILSLRSNHDLRTELKREGKKRALHKTVQHYLDQMDDIFSQYLPMAQAQRVLLEKSETTGIMPPYHTVN